jgi:hypothetical protein
MKPLVPGSYQETRSFGLPLRGEFLLGLSQPRATFAVDNRAQSQTDSHTRSSVVALNLPAEVSSDGTYKQSQLNIENFCNQVHDRLYLAGVDYPPQRPNGRCRTLMFANLPTDVLADLSEERIANQWMANCNAPVGDQKNNVKGTCMRNGSTTYVRLTFVCMTICTICLMGCKPNEPGKDMVQLPPRKLVQLPPDMDWAVFLSPIVGISEPELNRWRHLELEMSKFRNFEGRISIGDHELLQIRSGEIGLFDCSKYVIDESLVETLCSSPNVIGLRIGPREETDSFEWISKMQNLRVLDVSNNDFSTSKLTWLAKLDKLNSLSISRCNLPFATVNWLPVGPELCDLHAHDVVFSDAHMKLMRECPNLQRLELYYAEVTDIGFAEFPRIAKDLEFLWLVRNRNMTSASIRTFGRLTRLRFVHLGSTVIEESEYESYNGVHGGVPALEKVLPNCVFMYGT